MTLTTVVLADDHHVVRQGLRALLEAESDFSVVGEAGDGLEAVQIVERLKPDVLVVDLVMPGLSGLEVIRRTTRQSSRTRIVVLSMHADEGYVLEALRNGASAYVMKDSTAANLAQALREVSEGRRYFSPPLSEYAIQAYAKKANDRAEDRYDTLTNREREVFQLAAEGHGNPQIAARLCVSPRTVEAHRASLMHKLGLRNQTDLVRYAIRRGILPHD